MPILTDDELRQIAAAHFGDLGEVEIARAVALAESGGNTEAVNDNYPTYQPDPNSIYRYDYGLWQVNSVHCLPVGEGGLGFDSSRLLSDPDYNGACARRIRDIQGWLAWTTYKGGHYLAHLVAAPETAPEAVPEAPEPTPEPEQPSSDLPPALSLDDVYKAVSDAYIQAYDIRNTQFEPVRYELQGTARYAVYELRIEVPQ